MSETDRQRWDRKYTAREGPAHFRPGRLLVEHRHLLAGTGQDAAHQPEGSPGGLRALDVACGFGGSSLYLASLGYRVDAVDVSGVALAQVQAEASRRGLQVNLVQADLTHWWVPPAWYDLIVVKYYLNRDLMPRLARGLRARGLLFVEHRNLRYLSARPGFDPAFLLQFGELQRFATDAGLDLLHVADGAPQAHESRLIARRPA
ncbi:MAG: methyltransferase domain-containing protein [Anaerolineae bacterium]|nr:methyltransferase domain-containing protein [Anaerolineae bacterium]